MDNQSLSRSVWQDLSAIRGQNHIDPADEKGPGRQIVFPGALRPNLVDYIIYDQTDFLQVQGHVAICCPADLNTNSAALRYILRECGSDKIFQLRPTVGEVLTIPSSLSFMDNQVIHLMITRPSQRSPQITDDFFLCLEHLKASLLSNETPDIHFPIVDPYAHFAVWTIFIIVSWTFLQELISLYFCMIASMSPLPVLNNFLASLSFNVKFFWLIFYLLS